MWSTKLGPFKGPAREVRCRSRENKSADEGSSGKVAVKEGVGPRGRSVRPITEDSMMAERSIGTGMKAPSSPPVPATPLRIGGREPKPRPDPGDIGTDQEAKRRAQARALRLLVDYNIILD